VGNCVMPKEGIFVRVVDRRTSGQADKRASGSLTPDTTLLYQPKIFSTRIITLSDRAFCGEYEDKSGPRIAELLGSHYTRHETQGMSHEQQGTSYSTSHVSRLTSHMTLLPDDPQQLRAALSEAITAETDFIFTTGGTGIGPRDFTPDVVKPMLDKEIPGIMELIRTKYGTEKHQALLSRSIAGIAANSLIFTLPGSVKAVNEYLEEILKSLMHMVWMLHGLDMH
ncbi:MAG: MogA/MoaB family molybdenum cofactor biosynthesis protein, partial [Bacteroidales bacterium]|nr:MogA/MoaB family molybdenum cofactor biosynthesis protein [Bacteroidales bacterium]